MSFCTDWAGVAMAIVASNASAARGLIVASMAIWIFDSELDMEEAS